MSEHIQVLPIFELECRGAEHELFNAAFMDSLAQANPGVALNIFARETHLGHLAPRLAHLHLQVQIDSFPGDKGNAPRLGILAIVCGVIGRVRHVSHRPLLGMVFTSCSVKSFVAIKLVARLMPRTPILVVFHGVLEKLDPASQDSGLTDRVFRWLFKSKLQKNLTYCVLGPSIYTHLMATPNAPQSGCIYIEHPYVFQARPKSMNNHGKVTFGHIGYAHAAKGFLSFLAVAEQFIHDPARQNKADFLVVGGIDPTDSRIAASLAVSYASTTWPVPRDRYEAILQRLTYTVFTHPLGAYRLRASGSVFDALEFLVPIICLRNPYFEHIFGIAGDIGYLCDSPEELLTLCQSIADSFPEHRYAQQVRNLEKAQSLFTPKVVAQQLRERYFSKLGRSEGT